MIQPGTRLPADVPLKVMRNGKATRVRLRDLLSRPTVLSVYMRNHTSACDLQVASLVRAAAAIDRRGYDLIALGRDTCTSLAKYAAAMGVGFVLASDPDFLFSRAADAVVEKSMYGKKFLGPVRAAYVLDPDGTVRAVIQPVDPANHGQQVLAAVPALPR